MEQFKSTTNDAVPAREGTALESIKNYSGDTTNTASLICGFLKYITLAGSTYNYQAEHAGCCKVVYSRNGTVIAISDEMRLQPGGWLYVTPRAGTDHGIACC